MKNDLIQTDKTDKALKTLLQEATPNSSARHIPVSLRDDIMKRIDDEAKRKSHIYNSLEWVLLIFVVLIFMAVIIIIINKYDVDLDITIWTKEKTTNIYDQYINIHHQNLWQAVKICGIFTCMGFIMFYTDYKLRKRYYSKHK